MLGLKVCATSPGYYCYIQDSTYIAQAILKHRPSLLLLTRPGITSVQHHFWLGLVRVLTPATIQMYSVCVYREEQLLLIPEIEIRRDGSIEHFLFSKVA